MSRLGTTRNDLAAYDAVQEIAVATLLQRISNECSAAAGSDTAPNGVDWGSVGIIVENAAKEVRRITGEREVPFRAS